MHYAECALMLVLARYKQKANGMRVPLSALNAWRLLHVPKSECHYNTLIVQPVRYALYSCLRHLVYHTLFVADAFFAFVFRLFMIPVPGVLKNKLGPWPSGTK